ncbi:hypothetical protein [Meiothermus granaticius]|uniref:Lipoprotein n=1 Tax=Meiothermus granaticius NBRC 107808 TaxID=1227551 RepID=A0A399FAT6_9DEIN|nr:hypothetical protein [Meiothermus granaticius]RIH92806.1 hypothetical protein Mgrana_01211 [Meiothermus granaticius NBRC 107808]GEM85520.1 hypothetical protein MGR01S_01450 [Meiothermus granaticius NBRC 107808]
MRILFVALLLAVAAVFSGCAPQTQANPGEVVYDVPRPGEFNQPRAAGNPVEIALAQSVAAYYALGAQPLPGYGRWVQRLSEGPTAIYVSEKRDASGKVVATIEMRWSFGVRPDGYGVVKLQTLSTEKIDVGAVEGPAFRWLDHDFTRVAGAR